MIVDEQLIQRTKGFLDADEGRGLYQLALAAGTRGPCLEIGSYCGKSALYLGAALKSVNGTLFSIDHHRGSEEQQPGEQYFDPELLDTLTGKIDTFRPFRETLALGGLEDTVVPIVSRSDVVAREWATPLSLIFIDGGHAYETVLADYENWADHLMPEGYLLFHDIFPDPQDGGQAPYLVFQRAIESGRYRQMPMIKTLGVLQRIA